MIKFGHTDTLNITDGIVIIKKCDVSVFPEEALLLG